MVFIIGGRGFVGSAIVRYCEKYDISYKVITRQNYDSFKGCECDILINANGNSKKYLADTNPKLEFEESVQSVRNSLDDFKAEFYVHLSSCDVYPDCSSPISTKEDASIDFTKQSRYGFHKYLAEQCVQHYASEWLIVRMGGFVGPGLKKNPIYDILTNNKLWVDPLSELQYMHTDDFANTLFKLIGKNIRNQVVNVSGKGTVRIADVISFCQSASNTQSANKLVQYNISIDKLCALVDVTTSEESVKNFIENMGNKNI